METDRVVPFAPGVPKRLIVGHERAFLTWFYDGATARRNSIDRDTVDEYLRTFSGTPGVLGAPGVCNAAFETITQTEPLQKNKVKVPLIALGGEKGLNPKVQEMVKAVAASVEGLVLPDCGHFIPKEAAEEVVRNIQALVEKRPEK